MVNNLERPAPDCGAGRFSCAVGEWKMGTGSGPKKTHANQKPLSARCLSSIPT